MIGLHSCSRVSVERVDDRVEVGEHLPVHLGKSFAGRGPRRRVISCRVCRPLLAMLGQEFRGGQEHLGQVQARHWRAGQALLDGARPASSRWAGLGWRGPAAGFGPGGFGERTGRVQSDCVAVDVDFAGRLPSGGARLVSCSRALVSGHLRGVVVEDAAHDLLGDVAVDSVECLGCGANWCGVSCTGRFVLVADVARCPASAAAPSGRWGLAIGWVPSDVFWSGRGISNRCPGGPAFGGVLPVFGDQVAGVARRSGPVRRVFILWLT